VAEVGVKLLHFGDLHLDAPFRWAPLEVARSHRRALRKTLTRICRLAGELDADALCCAGDLYEQERFTPDTAEFLRSSFAELAPTPVFIAPGNHDWYGPSSLYRQVEWSANVHVFEQGGLAAVELADGITLWGAGHRAPANTPGFLDGFHVDRSGVHLALFHGSEQGELAYQGEEKIPHAPFRAGEISAAGLDHALLGHFHTPRDAPLYTYPGNPDPLTFGETGDRGAVLLQVAADGAITRERHRVAVSAMTDVTVDLTGTTHSGQVDDRVLQAVAGLSGMVRVTLIGEVGPDVDLRLQDVEALPVPHLDALVARLGQVFPAYDLESLKEEPTVRGQFVRDVQGSLELTEDQRRRVLVTGLRALAGRGDELEVQ
jgi:DNA repair exonuclease SbcCD nuclease subunit